MKTYRNLIIATQVLSISITLTLIFSGFRITVAPETIESLGGTLSTALLVVGAVCHFQARRNEPHMGMLALLGCFGPAYALIDDPGRYLFGFHLVALGFHGFVLWGLYKTEAKKANPEAGRDEPA